MNIRLFWERKIAQLTAQKKGELEVLSQPFIESLGRKASEKWGLWEGIQADEPPTQLFEGQARMGIDKIIVKCPRQYIVAEVAAQYRESPEVHFLSKGGEWFVAIHMEWAPQIRYQGIRILWAFNELAKLGALDKKTSAVMKILAQNHGEDTLENAKLVAAYFSTYHELKGWEMAYDFFLENLVTSYSEEDFRKEQTSIYTKRDYRIKWRLRKGKLVREVTQRSGLSVYRWDLAHGGDRRCDRMEFRFHGEMYTPDLSWDLLLLSPVGAHRYLLPAMARMMRNLTEPKNLVFNEYWRTEKRSPWWLDDLLGASQWEDPEEKEKQVRRRSGGGRKKAPGNKEGGSLSYF